jgi:fimbrial isopeptide formation D2 family protein/uncharacterized repeat protein (TIGR02543 family)/LPXTG-motif cell wall-anchored protein
MSRFKKIPARIISMLLVALMICAMLPVNVFAASQETLQVPFGILYFDNSLNIGYTYKTVGTKSLTCQYTSNHASNSSHCVAYNDIRTARDEYASQVDDGFKIVGWTSTATPGLSSKVNNVWYGSGVGASAHFQNGYTIYLVAEKENPDVTYTLSYDANGGTGAPEAQSETNNTGSATFTIPETTPTKEGYTFENWAGNGSTYAPGASITITANTTLTATWKEIPHEHTDSDGNGYCDEDNTCLHAKDEDGYCTVEGCAHPHEGDEACCPLKPAHEHKDENNDGYCDEDNTCLHAKDEDGYCTVEGCEHPHEGDEACCPLKPTTPVDPEEPDDKVSEPGMDKKNGESDTLGTVDPGTVFNFTLNSHIGEDMLEAVTAHQNGDYEGTYTLVFHDKMENLSFVDGSLTVNVGEITLTADQYTLSNETNDGCTFHVTIDCVALLNAGVFEIEDAGSIPVTVAYQAKVSDDAADNTVIKNSAWVNNSAVDVLEGDVDDTIPTPPSTGGNGTMMYTVLGVALMGVAAVAFVVSRKKRSAF